MLTHLSLQRYCGRSEIYPLKTHRALRLEVSKNPFLHWRFSYESRFVSHAKARKHHVQCWEAKWRPKALSDKDHWFWLVRYLSRTTPMLDVFMMRADSSIPLDQYSWDLSRLAKTSAAHFCTILPSCSNEKGESVRRWICGHSGSFVLHVALSFVLFLIFF